MNAAGSLNGQQLGRLIAALIDAFPSHDQLEMLLSIQLTRSFIEIAGTGELDVCVFKLVRAAMREGWLPALINAAVDRQPGNAKLRAWVESNGQVSGLEITATSPILLPSYELVKSMNFDLTELHKVIIGAVKAPVSSVLGFATRYPDDVFVAKLCDWLESRVANTRRKDALNLWPEIGSVSERLHALARYKGDLDSANVVCKVFTQGVPGPIVTEFWRRVHQEFAGINRLLLLVFACDSAATLPEGMIELPLPRFEVTDIDIWTLDMVHLHGWPVELASAWTDLLCDEAIYNGVLDVRGLYQAMDQTIEEIRYEAHSFRMRLEGRIGYADAP